jgi:hypothetical protein
MTVTTLGQAICRLPVGDGCAFMVFDPVFGPQSL